MIHDRHRVAQGQAMVEFLIILPVLLLLLLGTLQFALVYHARNTLNHATYVATRDGTLNNARRRAIELGFARGMAPLYTSDPDVDAVQAARDQVKQEIEDGLVCIERINPTNAAFQDFGVPNAAGVIPNDNLRYRSSSVGASGLSIQDANLLKLRIRYCYVLFVPLAGPTISGLWTTNGTFDARCQDAGGLPITAQQIMRMQTPVQNDVFPASCA